MYPEPSAVGQHCWVGGFICTRTDEVSLGAHWTPLRAVVWPGVAVGRLTCVSHDTIPSNPAGRAAFTKSSVKYGSRGVSEAGYFPVGHEGVTASPVYLTWSRTGSGRSAGA